MKIGLFFESADYAMPVPKLAELAEDRGFESLWLPEHSHMPLAGGESPRGEEPPQAYSHLLDPFVGLAAAAAVTKELRLGTGVYLIIEHDTIQTAKAVASLDHLSGGRFEFGIGAGWNRAEMENHGVDYASRYRKMRDQVAACRVIWRDEAPSYRGPFVNFEPIESWPKPVQSPHPPIHLGGETIHTLRRVVSYCDGWLPRGVDTQQILEGVQTLRGLAETAGREIPTSVFAPWPREEVLSALAAAGVERSIMMLPAEREERTVARLDRLARFLTI